MFQPENERMFLGASAGRLGGWGPPDPSALAKRLSGEGTKPSPRHQGDLRVLLLMKQAQRM